MIPLRNCNRCAISHRIGDPLFVHYRERERECECGAFCRRQSVKSWGTASLFESFWVSKYMIMVLGL